MGLTIVADRLEIWGTTQTTEYEQRQDHLVAFATVERFSAIKKGHTLILRDHVFSYDVSGPGHGSAED